MNNITTASTINNNNTVISLMSTIKGNKIIRISYETACRMNKGGRNGDNYLYGRVTKAVETKLQIGMVYENAVNNRSEKESGCRTFETESIKGKKWVEGLFSYILTNMNETQYYLRTYLMKNEYPDTEYFVDGRKATAEEMAVIDKYKIINKFSEKQAENGLTENQVRVMDLKIENISRIVVDGVEYRF